MATKKKVSKKKFAKKNIPLPNKIEIHYKKTSNYRSYHADGVYGGLTPNKKLYMEFFIQRQVTPQLVEHKVTKEGNLGKEIKRIGKKGIIREIEAGFIMDIEIAKVLRDWLDEKIKGYEDIIKT